MNLDEPSFIQELDNAIPSMEGFFSEIAQSVGNIFKYSPWDDSKLQKGAIDPVAMQVTNIRRLKSLLDRCYGDPRWLRAQTLRTDTLGPQGIVNLVGYGRQFDQENPARMITNGIYSLDAFCSGWAKATLRHSELVRERGKALVAELEDAVAPYLAQAEEMSEYVKSVAETAREEGKRQAENEQRLREAFRRNVPEPPTASAPSRPNPYATPARTGGTPPPPPGRPNPYAIYGVAGRTNLRDVLDSDGDVDKDAVWHNFAQTVTFKQIVDKHLNNLRRDRALQLSTGESFWNNFTSEIPTFGATMLRPRQGQLIKAELQVTGVRPLTLPEISEFVMIIKRLLDVRGLNLWSKTIASASREGLFFSGGTTAYKHAQKYQPELKEFLDSHTLMTEWKRGAVLESNLQALIIGMINWMSRSFVKGQRL